MGSGDPSSSAEGGIFQNIGFLNQNLQNFSH